MSDDGTSSDFGSLGLADACLPTAAEVTQAEAVSYPISRGVGFETNSAAADYIALNNGNNKKLAQSLSVIQETSSRILGELLPEQRRSHKRETQVLRDGTQSQTQNEPDRAGTAPVAKSRPEQSDSISMDR